MVKRSPASRAAAAEAHYRRLFESAPVGIYALDAEGEFTEINPAAEAILARSEAELIGSHFSLVVADEDLDAARELTERLAEGELPVAEIEAHVMRPDGERRLVYLKVAPIVEEGAVIGAHGVALDVTEERARESFVHRAERVATVGTLLSGVAHELNNPLNVIRNFAQLMLLDARSEDDREALEIIRGEADRAAKIVADLRSITRQGESGQGREPLDLNELVRRVLRLRDYSLETKGIAMVEHLSPDLPEVLANRAELEQALLNLVLNAEEALAEATEHREIEIRTRRAPGGVQLQIGDTGEGISPAHLKRVFDPFWTTKSPREGAGLGLSLVHRIITDHGGDVRARSEPGAGAVFTLTLRSAAEDAAQPGSSIEPASRSLRVLVVDDERPLRGSITRYLRRRGHQVDEAGDGAEALELIARDPGYDVVVTDLRMPGMSGEELLTRLRDAMPGFEEKVVVITGDPARADAANVLESTGVPILLKPVRLEDIAVAVERLAAGQ